MGKNDYLEGNQETSTTADAARRIWFFGVHLLKEALDDDGLKAWEELERQGYFTKQPDGSYVCAPLERYRSARCFDEAEARALEREKARGA